jgi:hypothetical protein
MRSIVKIITLAVALVAGCALPRAEPEIHLIPKGYVGWVTIAFGAANGEAPAFEGNAREYRIPSSGILITQAKTNVGSSPAWRFFFEDPERTRTPIVHFWTTTVHDTEANRADATVGIAYIRRGRQQVGPCDVEYDQYFVGTKAQLLSAIGREPEPHETMSQFLAANYRC